jgi:hypothetical protein
MKLSSALGRILHLVMTVTYCLLIFMECGSHFAVDVEVLCESIGGFRGRVTIAVAGVLVEGVAGR